MIPDEAVEVAARAIFQNQTGMDWESRSSILRDTWLDDARAALEAAAPHLLAPVVDLAEQWRTQGEDEMAASKEMQDEHIAMVLLTEGAAMVENARHIRNAIAQTGVKA